MSENKVVIFKIEGEEFAADIMQVERILGYTAPTKIPDSPDYITGVIEYQGEILPIMNLRKKFNLSNNSVKDDPKIIVVKHENKSIGLIVDTVFEVLDVNAEDIIDAPEIVKGVSNKYISGVIKLKNRIIILINTSRILSRDELKEIETIA